MCISGQPLKTSKARIQSTSHDTSLDQTHIYKIIKTDANVCLTNSENKINIQIKKDVKNYSGQLV